LKCKPEFYILYEALKPGVINFKAMMKDLRVGRSLAKKKKGSTTESFIRQNFGSIASSVDSTLDYTVN
jgi:hypothetical protein